MNSISAALTHVTLGLETAVQGLAMFPLLETNEEEPAGEVPSQDPLTLDEALSSGWARVTEISEAGSVPELRIANTATRPVFVLDGEELVGAKQNRVVNLSLLVPPASSLTIPVSCVEAGRWHARSRTFSAAPRVQYAEGRARKMRQVTASMLSSGARCADQGDVWDGIALKAARLSTSSETSAMEAMFVNHASSIEAFVEGLGPVPGQVGALFAVGDAVAGFELFGSAVLLRKLLPKVVRSYALDSIDMAASGRPMGGSRSKRAAANGLRTAAEHFIKRCAGARGQAMPALGLGHDLRVDAPGLTAAALVHDEHVVHLSAFAA